jgi:hypothetical protein
MRRSGVVAIVTAVLLTLTGLVAEGAAAKTPSSHVASARSASLVASSARNAVRSVKRLKKAASTTFSNATHSKPAAKKPAAKKPAAKKPAAKKPAAKKPAATSAPVSRAVSLARGNRASSDVSGWLPSLYQGTWFRPEVEAIRKCIMDRESNFNYRAVGAGTYFGAYQMNRGLAVGATRTMEAEVRTEMGAEGVRILRSLRSVAPNHWNRYWQDRAFYTVWRNGAGKGNWRGGGLNCF